jgi:hypothetical protein
VSLGVKKEVNITFRHPIVWPRPPPYMGNLSSFHGVLSNIDVREQHILLAIELVILEALSAYFNLK